MMRVWQQKETVSDSPLAWSQRLLSRIPITTVCSANQLHNEARWMGISRKAKVNVFRTDLHSFYQQRRRSKSPEHLYWLSGPCAEVRYLWVEKASVCSHTPVIGSARRRGFKPFSLFPPSLPPSNELKQWATAPAIVTSVLQKRPDGLHVNYNKEPGVLINDSLQRAFVAQKKSEHLTAFCIHMYLETDVKMAEKEHEFDCK